MNTQINEWINAHSTQRTSGRERTFKKEIMRRDAREEQERGNTRPPRYMKARTRETATVSKENTSTIKTVEG